MAMIKKFSVFSFQFSVKTHTWIFTHLLKTKNAKLKTGARGFSLVELLVVVAIITIITSVVLASNTRYGGSVLLQNLAYDIALSIRQAQVYGISVRGFGDGNGNRFRAGYGMHFSTSDNDKTRYELFADKDGDGLFDSDENVPPSPYVIGRGYYIAKLCAPEGARPSDCTSKQRLDILFRRPEPDAEIRIPGTTDLQENARVVVQSPRGDIKSIIVTATGQISVQ